jgi:uncharacterized protein involved in cysteine biosynthesis
MDGDGIDSRCGDVPVGDPEDLELLSEFRRLRRLRRSFRIVFQGAVVGSVALLFLGQFWIGVSLGAIAIATWMAALQFINDPTKRYNARNTARNEALAAKRGVTGRGDSR